VAAVPQEAEPAPLKLAVDRVTADVVARLRQDEMPHFEEQVEVRNTHQEALETQLRGADRGCGASAWGAPTRYEMNPYRGSPIPVHVDLVPAASVAYSWLKGRFSSKEPRWFLYAVRREPKPGDTGGAIVYVVREGRLPEYAHLSVPGTSFELIAGFRGQARAASALRRLQRGFPTLARARADDAPPPWFSTPCPLPRFE
jgi:hypothetical protein